MNRRQLPNLAPTAPVNNTLRLLLEQGALAPDETRVMLLQELQTAKLLVPIREPATKPDAGRQPNLQIAVLEHVEGKLLCGFTDIAAYRAFAATQHLPYAVMAAVDVCRLAREGNFRAVLLNGGGPVSYAMTPLEYQMVAERLLPGEEQGLVVNASAVVVGLPKQRPDDDVIQAMRAVVQEAGAQDAYWFWLAFPGGIPHLGVAVAPPDTDRIAAIGNGILPLWKAAHPDNTLLDILPLDDSELGQTIRANGERLV